MRFQSVIKRINAYLCGIFSFLPAPKYIFFNYFIRIVPPRTKVSLRIYSIYPTFLSPFFFLINLHYSPCSIFFSVKTVNIYPFVCVEWKEGGGGFLLLAVTGVIVKLYCFSDSSLKHGYWIFIMNVSVLRIRIVYQDFLGPLERIRIVIIKFAGSALWTREHNICNPQSGLTNQNPPSGI